MQFKLRTHESRLEIAFYEKPHYFFILQNLQHPRTFQRNGKSRRQAARWNDISAVKQSAQTHFFHQLQRKVNFFSFSSGLPLYQTSRDSHHHSVKTIFRPLHPSTPRPRERNPRSRALKLSKVVEEELMHSATLRRITQAAW